MIVEPIGIVALVVGPLCVLLGLRFAAFALILSTLFGASAAIILPALGNANIQPAHLMLAFFTLAAVLVKGFGRHAVKNLLYPNPGFWLALTVLYGMFSAYYFPRLFSGSTYVFGIRGESGSNIVLSPLSPGSGNVTQTVYFAGDLVCFLVCQIYARNELGKRSLCHALLLCAVVNLVFAVLDVATYATNTTELLTPIRNSTYKLLNDAEEIGLKRIVGSFSEASAFGYTTLGLFGFSTQLWLDGVYPRTTFLVSSLSLIALFSSTSTTAYVGTSIFLMLLFIKYLWCVVAGRVTCQMLAYLIGTPIITLTFITGILLNDAMAMYIHDAIDTVFLTKLSSNSGIERASWNAQAMTNFFDTYTLGGGIGSLRASSFPVAVLASIGLIGGLLYGAFLFSIFFPSKRDRADYSQISGAVQRAARSGCLALFIAASFTSAFVDLGLQFFVLAALASAPPDRLANNRRRNEPNWLAR